MPTTFRLEIVTPEALVYTDAVESLVIPADEGYLGVLAHHAPLLCTVKPGEIMIRKGGVETVWATSGGFMEVSPEKTIILADTVESADQIDVERSERAADRARHRLAEHGEIDVDRASAALSRALNRIKSAKK